MSPAALLVLVVFLLAACGAEQPQSCPGTAVGRFAFTASLVAAGDPALAGTAEPALDPVSALTDCAAAIVFPATLAFGGTLAADGGAGALCRTAGPVLFGTRTGENRWAVETGTDGAVLGGCDPTCAARSRVFVTGDVVPDASAPAGFQGALVEELTQTGGACGACAPALPCARRYVLTATLEAE